MLAHLLLRRYVPLMREVVARRCEAVIEPNELSKPLVTRLEEYGAAFEHRGGESRREKAIERGQP